MANRKVQNARNGTEERLQGMNVGEEEGKQEEAREGECLFCFFFSFRVSY